MAAGCRPCVHNAQTRRKVHFRPGNRMHARGGAGPIYRAPRDAQAIASELEGLRVQFDLPSAPRARGLSIDWVEDARGRGLVIENPNAVDEKPVPVTTLVRSAVEVVSSVAGVR